MGLLDRLRLGLSRTTQQLAGRFDAVLGRGGASATRRQVEVADLEALEELLIVADVGVAAAGRIVDAVRAYALADGDLRSLVKAEIRRIFDAVDGLTPPVAPPEVILVVGVNGTGKTTTVAKLARLFKHEGRRPLICGADTFRAAAIEQLDIWARRAGVDIVSGRSGADPAAAVFDAISAGRTRRSDPILIDTAGRLHNRANLMKELDKIRRVIAREAPGGPHQSLLVLDATVGQNGLVQAREFMQSAGVNGVVLTKLDGTAKGGVAIAIAHDLQLPIRFVGVGEGLDDIARFSPQEYVEALFEQK
jgi:fused signal recognition particle receptor